MIFRSTRLGQFSIDSIDSIDQLRGLVETTLCNIANSKFDFHNGSKHEDWIKEHILTNQKLGEITSRSIIGSSNMGDALETAWWMHWATQALIIGGDVPRPTCRSCSSTSVPRIGKPNIQPRANHNIQQMVYVFYRMSKNKFVCSLLIIVTEKISCLAWFVVP